MSNQLPDDDIRGMAIAGWTLAMGLIGALHGNGVFTDAQADAIIEIVLGELERFQGASDPGLHKARQFVDELGRSMARGRTP